MKNAQRPEWGTIHTAAALFGGVTFVAAMYSILSTSDVEQPQRIRTEAQFMSALERGMTCRVGNGVDYSPSEVGRFGMDEAIRNDCYVKPALGGFTAK